MRVLLECSGGTLTLPVSILNDRGDGGHLIVNPPRSVWERSELTPQELAAWSYLVAASGRAMLDVLPQLADGCINYWEAGNWALNDSAPPAGPKDPRQHRRVHLHLLGRSPRARSDDWRWGESPRFPDYAGAASWAARNAPLDAGECEAVVRKASSLLRERYGAS